jgi:hypothetical protein
LGEAELLRPGFEIPLLATLLLFEIALRWRPDKAQI